MRDRQPRVISHHASLVAPKCCRETSVHLQLVSRENLCAASAGDTCQSSQSKMQLDIGTEPLPTRNGDAVLRGASCCDKSQTRAADQFLTQIQGSTLLGRSQMSQTGQVMANDRIFQLRGSPRASWLQGPGEQPVRSLGRSDGGSDQQTDLRHDECTRFSSTHLGQARAWPKFASVNFLLT